MHVRFGIKGDPDEEHPRGFIKMQLKYMHVRFCTRRSREDEVHPV